jgi:hypothetical protein
VAACPRRRLINRPPQAGGPRTPSGRRNAGRSSLWAGTLLYPTEAGTRGPMGKQQTRPKKGKPVEIRVPRREDVEKVLRRAAQGSARAARRPTQ